MNIKFQLDHLFFFRSVPCQIQNIKNQTNKGHLRYTRSSTFNYGPYHSSIYPHRSFAAMGSPYYHRDMEDPISPALPGHHRSRSASRPPVSHTMDYPSTLTFWFRRKIFLDWKFEFKGRQTVWPQNFRLSMAMNGLMNIYGLSLLY